MAKPKTTAQLIEENIQLITNLEEQERDATSFGTKLAGRIINLCSNSAIVFSHLFFFVTWIVYNIFSAKPFDKFPFVLLITLLSLEAIMLTLFILIRQSESEKTSEKRNKLSLQIAMVSEQENTKLLNKVNKIAQKLGIEDDDDFDFSDELNAAQVIDGIDNSKK